jgi:hypothetical protein
MRLVRNVEAVSDGLSTDVSSSSSSRSESLPLWLAVVTASACKYWAAAFRQNNIPSVAELNGSSKQWTMTK